MKNNLRNDTMNLKNVSHNIRINHNIRMLFVTGLLYDPCHNALSIYFLSVQV